MSSKKGHHNEPMTGQKPDNSSETGPVANLEGGEPVVEKETSLTLEDMQKQLTDLQTQADEYKEGWQRSVADFQNYRRRMDAEKAETYQIAIGNIIKRYLPILDDLERALTSRPADLGWADGIELIYRKLQSILDAEGLKRIEAEGQMFDPHFHEAIVQEPNENYTSGQIIAIVQNGYMLGERVIRPAQVRVAK
jgi:molecular chaperone GrpE